MSTMLSKAPVRQVKDVRELLVNENARTQLAAVAARHMNPERMMRVVANAIRTTPSLQEVQPLSMLGALMNCAALGLEPNTPLGHAYLIPFKNNRKGITEVQLIIGYKGFADLARRSGQVVSLHADVVYSDDELWSYEYGSNMHLRHKPGPRKGTKLGAYCHVTLKDGQAFVFLPADEVLKIRDLSQGWRTAKKYNKTAESPWSTHEDRMWAKTAVRALANRGEMPLSIEFMEAMDTDDTPVDYAAYALNPDDGMIIEGEVDEGEAQDDKRAAQIEDKPKPAQMPREEKKSAPRQQESKSRAEEKPKQADTDIATQDEDEAEPAGDAMRDLFMAIAKDLEETGLPDAVETFHAENLDTLKINAPDLYDRITLLIEQARAFDNASHVAAG